MDLTIVIVSYNSAPALTEGLDELLSNPPSHIIIVDNNSTDDSREQIKERYPNIELIPQETNIGYGTAANAGFKMCKTKYALLLNPDIAASPEEITHFFINCLKTNKSWTIFAPSTSPKTHLKRGIIEADNVLGAAMLFDLDNLKAVGHFDENIFMFYEERDICRRVKQAGQTILLDTDLPFIHNKGTSSGTNEKILYLKQWHVAWSSAYYFKKHNEGYYRKITRMLFVYTVKSFVRRSKISRIKYKARTRGLLAFIMGKSNRKPNGEPCGVFTKEVRP